jgi:hypothetical protein
VVVIAHRALAVVFGIRRAPKINKERLPSKGLAKFKCSATDTRLLTVHCSATARNFLRVFKSVPCKARGDTLKVAVPLVAPT